MYGRANHRKVMMQKTEEGCLLNVRFSHTCDPPVGGYHYLQYLLFTIAMVQNDHLRGNKIFDPPCCQREGSTVRWGAWGWANCSLHVPTNYCRYQPRKLCFCWSFDNIVFVFDERGQFTRSTQHLEFLPAKFSENFPPNRNKPMPCTVLIVFLNAEKGQPDITVCHSDQNF